MQERLAPERVDRGELSGRLLNGPTRDEVDDRGRGSCGEEVGESIATEFVLNDSPGDESTADSVSPRSQIATMLTLPKAD